MADLKMVLDVVVAIVSLVGLPVAIVLFFLNKRRERLDREYGTYNALDEKYIEYLKLCVEHPDLDVFDLPSSSRTERLGPQRRELQIFAVLIAILERSFLMYRDKSRSVRAAQWSGWEAYIRDWATRPNFRRAWRRLSGEYDRSFENFMNALFKAPGRGRGK
jgi:hypothetical protein